jgi:CRP/FNR family transcriptional regulator
VGGKHHSQYVGACTDCPIRHSAVCAKCEPAEFARLEEIKDYRSFDAGQPVVWAGDQLEFVASVVAGVATISQAMEDGRTQIVGLLFPSDFIGQPGRAIAQFDVTAVSKLTLCCFRRSQFETLMDDVPRIGQRLLEMTLNELDAARDWMLILGRKTAREKTASLLLAFAKRHDLHQQSGNCSEAVVDLPLTRELMANYLGLSLETVSRTLSALGHDEIIKLEASRSIIIPDLAALMIEAGDYMDGGMLG